MLIVSQSVSLQCDLESQAYGKLGQMLRTMEAATANASSSSSSSSSSSGGGGGVGAGSTSAGTSPKSSTSDLERINDLLKVRKVICS